MTEHLDIQTALRIYCDPNLNIQSQEHVKPFHFYSATRLVLEGGFEPENILPHPPFSSQRQTLEKYALRFSPENANKTEATVLGGLRTKQIDLTVRSAATGPALGISFKTTNNAFRNIPNRVEELLGDVTNIHLRYPAFTYGFCHIIKMVRESDASKKNDISFSDDGEPVSSIRQFHDLLTQMVGRARISDRPEQYESVALLVIECTKDGAKIYDEFPPKESPVHFSNFFERLYRVYDERYCYVGADRSFCRKSWVLSNDLTTQELNLNEMQDSGSLLYKIKLYS